MSRYRKATEKLETDEALQSHEPPALLRRHSTRHLGELGMQSATGELGMESGTGELGM